MSFELRFFTQFQWREAYVLDNWQLAELPRSGGREFDPRRVYDNLSVPLGVICVSLYQSIKIKPTNIYPGVSSPVGNHSSCQLRVGSLLYRVCDTIRPVPVRYWRTGHGLVVWTLGKIAGGGVAFILWGPRSNVGSSTWSNALITGIYPAVSARRHVLMFPPYKNNIYEQFTL